MDIGRAFRQMFKDPKWFTKMIFFSLFMFLSMFLIGIPFTVGYTVLILNNYLKGKEELPEWEGNWELILMTGLKSILAGIIFVVVSWIVSFFTYGLIGILAGILSDTDGLEMIGVLLALVQMVISFVISAVITLAACMMQIRFALNLSFSDIFDFDWYVDFFKKSWGNLLVVWVLSIVTGLISAAGLIALCIGVFVTAFYAMVTNAALLAEAAKAAGEIPSSANSDSQIIESAPVSAPTVVHKSSSKDSKE